ncbi:MAG: putative metalloprotease CJM1_0395 family protein [Succinivibrio sp.]
MSCNISSSLYDKTLSVLNTHESTAASLSLNKQQSENEKENCSTLKDDIVTLSGAKCEKTEGYNTTRQCTALKAYGYVSSINTDKSTNASEESDKLTEATDPVEKKEKEEEKQEQKIDKNDKKSNGEYLTDEEQKELDELKSRDQEVKAHEQAHQRAGGSYASSPEYEYEKGPDGNSYATGGHVNIDVSKENTPEKTISKMQTVIKAAHAPAEPSSQDLKVAAQAQQTLAEAQRELQQQSMENSKTGSQDQNSNQESSKTADNAASQAPKELSVTA